MKTLTRHIWPAWVIVMLLLLAGCGAGNEGPSADPDATGTADGEEEPQPAGDNAQTSLTVALPGEPSTLDAQLFDDGNMDHVALNVLEGLTTRAQDMSIEPQLATDWEQVDETTWHFTLRPDVVFHNGDPLTAEDVAFSINRIIDPELEGQIVSYMATVSGASVVDDSTVAVTTTGPEPNLPAVLAFGSVAPMSVLEEDPEGFARSPVGTGPYAFESWEPGQHIRLTAFDDHWSGETPQIQDVEFVWREEAAVRFAALEAGEVDIASSLSPEQADRAPKVSTSTALEATELAFDTLSGPMADARVREAVNLAIDRQALRDNIFLGYAHSPEGQITVGSTLGHHDGLSDYPFDLEAARQLVEEAGPVEPIQFVAQRGRWVKDGEATEAIAEMIRQAGLEVNLEFLEWTQYLERIFDKESRVDITYFAGSNDTFDSSRVLNTLILCEATLSRFCDEEIDALHQQAVEADTREEREQIYHEIWERVYEAHAVAPLAVVEVIYGMQDNVDFQARADQRMKIAEITVT